MSITLTLRVSRGPSTSLWQRKCWQEYSITVGDGDSLLDALEAAEQQDPTLLYRHACHHACCGSCGLRVNGRERLACQVPAVELAGRPVRLEPLRGFPLLGDLAVEIGPFFSRLHQVNLPPLRASEEDPNCQRYENCIECGLCVSACPTAHSEGGPAALAAAGRLLLEPRGCAAGEAHNRAGEDLWRCHSAFECSQVCPTGVDPAGLVMMLRSKVIFVTAAIKEDRRYAV